VPAASYLHRTNSLPLLGGKADQIDGVRASMLQWVAPGAVRCPTKGARELLIQIKVPLTR